MQTATPLRIAVDVGIVVETLERSLRFYRDVIGLNVVAELSTSLIGRGRMVQLRHGASLLKLVQLDGAPSKRNSKGISEAFGYRYITLLVPDIEGVMARLEQAEVPVRVPITQLEQGAQIAMVEDPDGNVVEFVHEAAE